MSSVHVLSTLITDAKGSAAALPFLSYRRLRMILYTVWRNVCKIVAASQNRKKCVEIGGAFP
jgi:hypothetical protein